MDNQDGTFFFKGKVQIGSTNKHKYKAGICNKKHVDGQNKKQYACQGFTE